MAPSGPGAPPSTPRKAKRARGRPKDLDKRAAVLLAAKRLFTAQGLPGTSMEAIADAAGVSKLTVYSHFRNKEELFRETVFAKCNEHWPEDVFDVQMRSPLRERLRLIGRGFLDLVHSQDVVNMYRLMAAEGQSRFGRLFWEFGPERTLQRFAQVLEAAHRAGELHVPDPRRAASHFFVMLKGEHHIKALVGAAPSPDAAERQRHVEDVIDVFLRAYTTQR
ncbi:MAG: TetR/AcrR family transcriptional regulator [Panacagrimonas sp.]|jgi:TetR/AcrR family transcriptional repressor of mexJK operon|nr:TetR/AcrR family transcriptional regulator [Panacagrimonas sp.]MCC2656611.1 TetR/AcrR family transcriptional regulator [Panacagrimonas sp.]